jgi:hypothetical protein
MRGKATPASCAPASVAHGYRRRPNPTPVLGHLIAEASCSRPGSSCCARSLVHRGAVSIPCDTGALALKAHGASLLGRGTATEQKMHAVSSGNGVLFAPCDAIEPKGLRRIELLAAIDIIESAISEGRRHVDLEALRRVLAKLTSAHNWKKRSVG